MGPRAPPSLKGTLRLPSYIVGARYTQKACGLCQHRCPRTTPMARNLQQRFFPALTTVWRPPPALPRCPECSRALSANTSEVNAARRTLTKPLRPALMLVIHNQSTSSTTWWWASTTGLATGVARQVAGIKKTLTYHASSGGFGGRPNHP